MRHDLHDLQRDGASEVRCWRWPPTLIWPGTSYQRTRRTYQLTLAGEDRLQHAATELQSMQAILDAFLLRYDEGPTRDGRQRAARQAR